ncbi:hypothetical protein [Nocardia asiatica]|uniref:hypothetical protein n=1 Tax=Nocardia asiatica TaxID=209252 RepID=UPI003EDEBB25
MNAQPPSSGARRQATAGHRVARALTDRRGWDCTGSDRRELGTAECLGLIDEFERLRVTAVPVRTESSV